MGHIPDDPNTLLTRHDAALALTEAGFPISPRTLATKASRGGGPAYRVFNSRALYQWSDVLAWAQRMVMPGKGGAPDDGTMRRAA